MTIPLLAWQAQMAEDVAAVSARASEFVRAAAFQAQAFARTRVPVDTGFLRSSITVSHPTGRALQPGDLEAQVGPEANYGAYVEYGTSRMGGRPYMTPAAEVVGRAFAERMAREVSQL